MRRSFHLLALALPLAMGCKKPVPASYELKVAFSSHKRRRLHLQLDHSR